MGMVKYNEDLHFNGFNEYWKRTDIQAKVVMQFVYTRATYVPHICTYIHRQVCINIHLNISNLYTHIFLLKCHSGEWWREYTICFSANDENPTEESLDTQSTNHTTYIQTLNISLILFYFIYILIIIVYL